MTYTSLREFAEHHNLTPVLWVGRAPSARIRERLFRKGYLVHTVVWPSWVLADGPDGAELRTDLLIQVARDNALRVVVDGFGMSDEQRASLDHSRLIVLD